MTLTVERSGGVVHATLNRPDRKNALDSGTWRELGQLVDSLRESTDDRCLVLTGTGPDFCSGADMAERWLPDPPLRGVEMVQRVIAGLHDLPQPTIAKVRGAALGAGMCLAMACDLLVASDTARFSMKFAQWGLTPDCGGTWFLSRLVGVPKAKELALLGTTLSAADALALGIGNRVVPDDELDSAAGEWADALAAGPPTALYLTKRLIADNPALSLTQALDAEARAQSISVKSPDFKETMLALREKRAPSYGAR